MSDTEGDARAPAPAALPADVGSTDLYQALQEVLIHDGLSRGAKEATKALDKRQVHLCVFVNSVDESLCAKHGINLLKVNDAKKLVEWAGLCKLDKEDKARKVNACRILIVKDYGKATPALDVVRDYFKSK